MQAQYQRRRPAQLAADVIEHGLETTSLAQHRFDEAHMSFSHTWGLDMFAVAGTCMAVAVLLTWLIAVRCMRLVLNMIWPGRKPLIGKRGLSGAAKKTKKA